MYEFMLGSALIMMVGDQAVVLPMMAGLGHSGATPVLIRSDVILCVDPRMIHRSRSALHESCSGGKADVLAALLDYAVHRAFPTTRVDLDSRFWRGAGTSAMRRCWTAPFDLIQSTVCCSRLSVVLMSKGTPTSRGWQ
jgi:hypothetical protein